MAARTAAAQRFGSLRRTATVRALLFLAAVSVGTHALKFAASRPSSRAWPSARGAAFIKPTRPRGSRSPATGPGETGKQQQRRPADAAAEASEVEGQQPPEGAEFLEQKHGPAVLSLIDGVAFVGYALLFRVVMENHQAVAKLLPTQGLGGSVL
mmetsp:Transcript_35718/g.85300  ORF Transcript_35718/g.85300 Transcript_35718/m.85300 type:complete len:154 (+) Transcript_35718:74-535(+)